MVGLHFFSPANIMKLVEIVRGAKIEPAVLAAALGFVKQIGKVGVVAGVCDGFNGRRYGAFPLVVAREQTGPGAAEQTDGLGAVRLDAPDQSLQVRRNDLAFGRHLDDEERPKGPKTAPCFCWLRGQSGAPQSQTHAPPANRLLRRMDG